MAGNDATEVIGGEHAEGLTNTDVLVIESYNQNIRTVPSVLCRQFPNLNHIRLNFNNIQTFRESSFSGCTNLRELIVEANPIYILPAGLFASNAALETLWLDMNRIYSIENGMSINYLYIFKHFII
jgi:Leucine-rich repeat (LRR) protein